MNLEWNMIFELIDPRLFVVVSTCWVIGIVLKKTPKIPDWSIVYFVVVLAVLLTGGLLSWNIESLIQGILVGAFAVFGHQVVKQARIGVNDK